METNFLLNVNFQLCIMIYVEKSTYCINFYCKAGFFISLYKHDYNTPVLSDKQQENMQYWV